MRKKRFEDPETRRRQILEGASAALRKKHFHTLSMEDVARAAKISKGLLYLYFRDKEQLFAAVAEDMLAQAGHRIKTLGRISSPLPNLRTLIQELLILVEENKEFSTQFVGERLMGSRHAPTILTQYQAFLAELENRLKACIDAGLMRPHDTHLSSDILVDMVQLYMRRKVLMKRLPKPLTAYADDILDFLIHGFGPKGAAHR